MSTATQTPTRVVRADLAAVTEAQLRELATEALAAEALAARWRALFDRVETMQKEQRAGARPAVDLELNRLRIERDRAWENYNSACGHVTDLVLAALTTEPGT